MRLSWNMLSALSVTALCLTLATGMRSAPHDRLECTACHTIFHGDLTAMYTGSVSPYDLACLSCHDLATGTSSLRVTTHQGEHCYACHDPHYQVQVTEDGLYFFEGTIASISATELVVVGGGLSTNQLAQMLLIPDVSQPEQNFYISGNTADTITIDWGDMSATASAGDSFRVAYGKYIPKSITAPSGEVRDVVFAGPTGTNSFADGDATRDGVCEVCHTLTDYHRFDGSNPGGNHQEGTRCTNCHSHATATSAFQPSCTGCHDFPPVTASHLAHFDPNLLNAGQLISPNDLRHTSDQAASATTYIFGCGQCHPASATTHKNGLDNAGGGQAELLFNDPSAAADPIKGSNPSIASYTPGGSVLVDGRGFRYTEGSCSNIYCHSSAQRGTPTRDYVSMTWGSSLPANRCNACHGAPPQYANAGEGVAGANSHYTPDGWGTDLGSGHVLGIHWGHDATDLANGYESVMSCNLCHDNTVTGSDGVDTYFVHLDSGGNPVLSPNGATCSSVGCHTSGTTPPENQSGVITNSAWHVNGAADVAFSSEEFRTTSQLGRDPTAFGWTRVGARWEFYDYWVPSAGSYDAATRSCSNVACHLGETITWGAPAGDCTNCHGF